MNYKESPVLSIEWSRCRWNDERPKNKKILRLDWQSFIVTRLPISDVVTVIAHFSIQLNFLFSCREDMRNSFNFLLIALICMDSSYLIGWIIEAFRKSFQGIISFGGIA